MADKKNQDEQMPGTPGIGDLDGDIGVLDELQLGQPEIDYSIQEADLLESQDELPEVVAEKPTEDKSEVVVRLLESIAERDNQITNLLSQQEKPAVETPSAEQPQNLAEYLFGKDGAKEFVYDPEEAVKDPASDSAKYHRAEIAMEVQRSKLKDQQDAQLKEADARLATEKAEVMKEFGLDEAGFKKFEEDASKANVTLKDIYLMLHREEYTKAVAKNTVRSFQDQRTRMSQLSPAFSQRGGKSSEPITDSQVFASVFGVDNKMFKTTVD